MSQFPFIPPSKRVEHGSPPSGKGWCHEVKFDGYRLQLVKITAIIGKADTGVKAVIYSKNGKDFTARFRDLARAVPEPPCKSLHRRRRGRGAGRRGRPDFRALVGGQKHSRVA